jgi:hypothetical protein
MSSVFKVFLVCAATGRVYVLFEVAILSCNALPLPAMPGGPQSAESIESFVEDQAFCGCMIWLLTHPSSSQKDVLSFSVFLCVAGREKGGGGGGANQIIRPRESLVLY